MPAFTEKATLIKGETSCNRTACQRPLVIGQRYWNSSTRAYYCHVCARRINEGAGYDLCSIETPENPTPEKVPHGHVP